MSQNSSHVLLLVPHLIMAALLTFSGCGSDEPTEPANELGGPEDLPGAVTEMVIAAEGAVLRTQSGIEAMIPAGALPSDAEVSLIPVSTEDADGSYVAAARFEPEGLVLDAPITVSFPLPPDWDPDEDLKVSEFKGNDPNDAVPTHAWARVTGAPGSLEAEVLLSHFSGAVCVRNCHAGTIRRLLHYFQLRGCGNDDALQKARDAYAGVDIPDDGCGARSIEAVQAFLDTYFDDVGGWNAGEDVPASVLEETIEIAESGRLVALAFRGGEWDERGGPYDFYPTSVEQYAHTAILEEHEGQIQIRNSLATNNAPLVQALGGENAVWYPADRLNEFRQLPIGVAAELQACGEPDCLSGPNRNEFGLDVYHPIEGMSYIGRAWSDPWTYVLSEGPWRGIPPRGVPWTAVRIYVEKTRPPANPCAESFLRATATLDATETPSATRPVEIDFDSVSLTVGTNSCQIPCLSAFAYSGPNRDRTQEDLFELFIDDDLGVGTHAWRDGATMLFSSPRVRTFPSGSEFPVPWEPEFPPEEPGTITIEETGLTPGSRVRGTFSVNVRGFQTLNGEDVERVTGTIVGSFDLRRP